MIAVTLRRHIPFDKRNKSLASVLRPYGALVSANWSVDVILPRREVVFSIFGPYVLSANVFVCGNHDSVIL